MDDHLPPPPYSETDIYSVSGGHNSRVNSPSISHIDVALSGTPEPSHEYADSSADGSTIFTPPYTPDGSSYGEHRVFVDSEALSSAAAYFATRPVNRRLEDPVLSHTIVWSENPGLADIPYPQPEDQWLRRDLTRQDWATFINHLNPYHVDATNSDVVNRKIQPESIDHELQRLRVSDPEKPLAQTGTVGVQLDCVLAEWNEGFFGPRGLRITVSTSTSRSSPEKASTAVTSSGQDSRRGSSWMRADRSGFHLGNISADRNGFRVGNLLVADPNGFRLGPMVADSNGFRIGGSRASPSPVAAAQSGDRYGHHMADDRALPGPSGGQRGSHDNDHNGARGRTVDLESKAHANRESRSSSTSSSSSSSSSSSESSSDSEASIDSLPPYDSLEPSQLPAARRSLQEWLQHPEQPVTREAMQKLEQSIQETDARILAGPSNDAELKSLKQEVENLMRALRDVQRTQRRDRRASKRERRDKRRAAKRDRRESRRKAKSARKEAKSARKEAKSARKEARSARKEARKEGKRRSNGKGKAREYIPMAQASVSPNAFAHGPRGDPSSISRGPPIVSEVVQLNGDHGLNDRRDRRGYGQEMGGIIRALGVYGA